MADFVAPGEGKRSLPSSGAISEGSTTDVNWTAVEQDPEFRELIREKRSFIIPATIFFLLYYFVFLVLVGYFPDIANANVIGNINVAYLLALSQFIMVWVLMYLYVRRAGTFDRLAQSIVARVKGGKR